MQSQRLFHFLSLQNITFLIAVQQTLNMALFRLSRWTPVNLRTNFLHMLNLNSIFRKFSAGQFMPTLPSTNNKTGKGLYSCIKKRLREVCFAFVLIKVLDRHIPFSSCNINNFDKTHQKTLQDMSLHFW